MMALPPSSCKIAAPHKPVTPVDRSASADVKNDMKAT
jgi:hypothetical protein